jgi:hypothetical protein
MSGRKRVRVSSLNILHPQCFYWNAKPLRGGCAFREQRNMQWRMVSQHGVQCYVVGGGGARNVERRLDRRMRLKGEAAVLVLFLVRIGRIEWRVRSFGIDCQATRFAELRLIVGPVLIAAPFPTLPAMS